MGMSTHTTSFKSGPDRSNFFFQTQFLCQAICTQRTPKGTQVIVGSMNMGYISDTARNRTRNLFHPKREPIPLGHSDGLFSSEPDNRCKNRLNISTWLAQKSNSQRTSKHSVSFSMKIFRLPHMFSLFHVRVLSYPRIEAHQATSDSQCSQVTVLQWSRLVSSIDSKLDYCISASLYTGINYQCCECRFSKCI